MKGRNSCFYPQEPATCRRPFFFFRGAWLPASAAPSMEWMRGLRKPRKSLMSERIISVYESSSNFPQIPFHSGKNEYSPAKEEKKTFNATWQAKHPVWSKFFEHTLRIELMLYVLPVLSSSPSADNESVLWLSAYCTKKITRMLSIWNLYAPKQCDFSPM